MNNDYMDNLLNNILSQCGLIAPLDEGLVKIMEQACDNYLINANNDDSMDDLAVNYVLRKCSPDMKAEIKKYFKESFGYDLSIPECVWHALDFYVIYRAIVEEKTEFNKALYSCILQNSVILCKGNWQKLKFQSYLLELYGQMRKYLNEIDLGKKEMPWDWLNSIYGKEEDFTFEDSDIEMMRVVGGKAWKYELLSYSQNMKEDDPFVMVFRYMEFMNNHCPTYNLNGDIKVLVDNFPFGSMTDKKTLRGILTLLFDSDYNYGNAPMYKSSLILNMLYEKKLLEGEYLDVDFTPKEFFVYLYFELLAEKIME